MAHDTPDLPSLFRITPADEYLMPRFNIPLPMSGPSRRRRYMGRHARIGGVAGLIVMALFLLDRQGVFGRTTGPDVQRYDSKSCQVIHVTDGDTVDVDIPDGAKSSTRIRLLGMDTPETVKPDTPVQYFGPEASQYTKSHLLRKTVTLQLDKSRSARDKYGRLLAYIMIDGKNYNRQIVAEGYAYADPRFPHPLLKDFKAAQEQAKAAGAGLWRGVQDKDLPYYYQGKLKLPGR